jgi:hypothetical protein
MTLHGIKTNISKDLLEAILALDNLKQLELDVERDWTDEVTVYDLLDQFLDGVESIFPKLSKLEIRYNGPNILGERLIFNFQQARFVTSN